MKHNLPVCVYTMTHTKFTPPPDPTYQPLQVGHAIHPDLGYPGDDRGDHISDKNPYYCELTGQYWVWKNVSKEDYPIVGMCHYRRYLIDHTGHAYHADEIQEILKEYDLITTKILDLNNSYYYGYGKNHHIKDLDTTGQVIREKYPDYYDCFMDLVHQPHTYFGNMIICSKDRFDHYSQWLFDILFEVERRIDIENYDDYHKRVFGFISEFLLLVYARVQDLKVYECRVGMTGEKKETALIKDRLRDYFYKRDIPGAKAYFMDCYSKRPDILMEASDITGDLKRAMQVISTCDLEQRILGHSTIDRINDFDQLMEYFLKLNQATEHLVTKSESEMDLSLLHGETYSTVARDIALKMYSKVV